MISKVINRFTCNESQISSILKKLKSRNMYPILDYINENGDNHHKNYLKIKKNIINYPNNHFSIKLSSLNIHNDYNLAKQYAEEICEIAIENDSNILIDAEDYKVQACINTISNELMYKYNINKTNIYKTYQCYRKDSFNTIKDDLYDKDIKGYNLGVKLVRGAYYNQDAQYNILYENINLTHNNYNKCVEYLFNSIHENDRLMIATHNKETCELAIQKLHLLKNENVLSFAQLMGMGDNLSNFLSSNYRIYKYVPFGSFYESCPYLLRRLYENKDSIKYLLK
jgi:proline dehydrogenase